MADRHSPTPPRGWTPAQIPSGPITADYRRGIEDAAALMKEWASVADGDRARAYENAMIGILAILPRQRSLGNG
jgi:hypothetical protein